MPACVGRLRRFGGLVALLVPAWFAVLGTLWALFAASEEEGVRAVAWVPVALLPAAAGALAAGWGKRTWSSRRRAGVGVLAAGAVGLVVYAVAFFYSFDG